MGWGQGDDEEGELVGVEVSIWIKCSPVVALVGGLYCACFRGHWPSIVRAVVKS